MIARATAIVVTVLTATAGRTGRGSAQVSTIPIDSSVPTIRPGHPAVNGLLIKPHTNRWVITYLTPDGKPVPGGPKRVATWYDSVSVLSDSGRPKLHRNQVLVAPTGSMLETIDSWADARTLAPIRTESHYSDGTSSLREYRGARVTGFDPDSAAPGGRKPVDVALAEPAFDFFGGTYDLLLSGFPLRAGYRARFPADLGPGGQGAALQWVTITVAGRERIDAGAAGRFDTWHVVTDRTPVGLFEFWIAAEAPYMIRMWYIGPRGGKQIWNIG